MTTNNRKDELITLLLRDTLNSSLTWSVETAPYSLRQATEAYVPLYLTTTFRGTYIGIYERRNKHFTDVDEFYWMETLGICIIQGADDVVWQVEENSPALLELYELAREQASGLNDLLNF